MTIACPPAAPPQAGITVGGLVNGRASETADFYLSVAHILFAAAASHRSQHDSIMRAARACEVADRPMLTEALRNIRVQSVNINELARLPETKTYGGEL